MASSEKQMIPLEAIPQEADEGILRQPSAKVLVDVKFPSRPRRKVVIIAGVIAVSIVVIIAASLIGKYVPDYLSDANNKSERGSKDKETGTPEESIPSTSAEMMSSSKVILATTSKLVSVFTSSTSFERSLATQNKSGVHTVFDSSTRSTATIITSSLRFQHPSSTIP